MTFAETNEIRELTTAEADTVSGSRTDVIKAMGNTKWGDVTMVPLPLPGLIRWMVGSAAWEA